MKRVLYVLSLAMMLCLFVSCSKNAGLKGKYSSEGGDFTDFKKDGTCKWYQDGSFFDGEYKKDGDGFEIDISGSGLFTNTVFVAMKDGDDLIITGGIVYGERFIKGENSSEKATSLESKTEEVLDLRWPSEFMSELPEPDAGNIVSVDSTDPNWGMAYSVTLINVKKSEAELI